jgi:hypothetical protein
MTTNLGAGLADIVQAADRAVLLRETDLGSVIDTGDVDLLVAADSVPALLDTVDAVAEARGLHYRLLRSSPRKIGVTLFSVDLAHTARIDLWIELWQVFGGSSYLRYDDVQGMLVSGADGVAALPTDLEAAVYIQHLAVKGRNPADPACAARLVGWQTRWTGSCRPGSSTPAPCGRQSCDCRTSLARLSGGGDL